MTRLPRRRSAFTLIELLVVIFIVGVLAALLIPAVLASRESGRRVECMNHLKQIGVALSTHESSRGVYPSGFHPGVPKPGGAEYANSPLSAHYQLLPFIDQSSLYNAINLAPDPPLYPVAINRANETSATVRVSTFLCPSDAGSLRPGNNYRACVGSQPREFDGTPWRGGGGAFPGFRFLSGRDFADGQSQTAAFSERVTGGGIKSRWDKYRDIWFSGISELILDPDRDRLVELCAVSPLSALDFWAESGSNWIQGRYTDTLYNHVSTPNWSGMDCSVGPPVGNPGDVGGGVLTARSNHRGGVNLLLMDGSVKPIRSQISMAVWRSYGTRAGNEVLSGD